MEDLQLVLFVLGAIAIIAVLVHGFWSIRKQQPKALKDAPAPQRYQSPADRRDAQGFDSDGIGAVRVRKMSPPHVPSQEMPEPRKAFEPASVSGHGAQPSQAMQADATPQDFSLSAAPAPKAARQRHEAAQAQGVSAPMQQVMQQAKKMERTEPVQAHKAPAQVDLFAEAGYDTDYDDQHDEYQHAQSRFEEEYDRQPQSRVDSHQAREEAPLGEPRDVLVLHLVAPEGELLSGAELLPSMLTLSFKFGDMNIFHRHEDNAGNGKVLFSIANMVKPGTFDPDNMEQFSTQGLVMFMTLPCHGDPLMNFSIMLNSAHQLADDLGAMVLDGQRKPWQESTKQEYLRRIRAQA
jgi:cell division protein ZipA